MKRLVISTLFCCLLLTAFSFAQDVDKLEYPKLNKVEIPEVDRMTLDNGIRLYLLEDKSLPLFRASVRMNCGSYLEPGDKVGLADICGEVMRTGGTKKWSGDEIDEMLEAVGGTVETFIGLESGGATVNVLKDYTDLGLEVLADILRNPQFEEDKIDLAKVQRRSGIARRNDDPQAIAFREFRKVIYGSDSPYARHTEYATINAITRDDLVAFHKAWFHPQNMQIAVWGDFDKKEIVEKIKAYFADWPKGGDPVPPLPDVDYKFENKVYYINKPDVNQTNVLLGHIGGKVTDPDYGDRIVMNNIFGGGFGSRLFNSVRSREGLAYAVFGSYTANIKYPGIFVGFASTKSETTVKAVKEIISQMKRMQTEPPTKDEMRMGKDGYLNSFVFNFDSKAEVVNRLMNYDFYGLPEDRLFQVKNDVEQVTPEKVVEAAKNNIRPDALRIVVVGKGEDFEMPLDQAGLGQVVNVDITIPKDEPKKELAVNDESLAKGMGLINKAVDAYGGQDNLDNIESVSQKGSFLLNTPNGEFSMQYEQVDVYPDKSRQVISVMGQTMYTIRDGSTGWKSGMSGIVDMTEEDIVEMEKDNKRSTLRILRAADDPYYKAVYDGTGDLNGTPVEYVTILDKQGEQICRLGMDENGMIVTKEYWGQTQLGEGNIVDVLSDFQEFGGVMFAMQTNRTMDGNKVGGSTTTELTVNGEVAPDAFSKPE